MLKAAVLGLGAMGQPIAINLHKAQYLTAVWSRTVEKSAKMTVETGVVAAKNPEHLASLADVIIISVSRDNDLLEVIDAMEPGLRPGMIIIDTSTVGVETAREIATRLDKKSVQFLDCPVSGGVEGAKSGKLAMMAGGDRDALELVRPMLQFIATTIVHMGASGSGQATKAVNQIIAAGINQAVTEALAFGEALGLEMDKVIDVVSQGAAANWFLSHRGKTMLQQSFKPGFRVDLHHKDLVICKQIADSLLHMQLPIVESTIQDYQSLMNAGHGNEDISALFRLKYLNRQK